MAPGLTDILNKALTGIFGSKTDRDLKTIQPYVEEINEIYEGLASLSDDELRGKTDEFRQRLREGETTDDIMTEAFAVVKDVCRRFLGKTWMVMGQETTWDMVPYDCQLIGAIVLHKGKITEMATGEGKSLVATMPLYLNAISGKGVHFVTVNDYLVQRDVEWYGRIYEFLGLTVGYIKHDMDSKERRENYACDITYGTNNEFGFDYLRDNMAIRVEDVVQREFNYALVDEVDSVLIDEARTPLIISGPVGTSTHKYEEMKPLVQSIVGKQTRLVNSMIAEAEKSLAEGDTYKAGTLFLQATRGTPKNRRLMKILSERPEVKKLILTVENDYMRDKRTQEIDEELYFVVDEKNHTINFTDKALDSMPDDVREIFVLPDLNDAVSEIEQDESLSAEEKIIRQDEVTREFALKSEKIHNANQLLRAYTLFVKDQQYVVQDGKVLIVDEFTGRLMSGRRYSDGLHQALEAKENVRIEQETQTLATITLQNYFRMYDKLAGMTGTAETEAAEFWEIYKLDVVVIPTNKPVIRIDQEDRIYRTRREKYNAIIEEIRYLHDLERPVLVGTVNVEVSETLSRMLKRAGIRHSVLNAKQHQSEAEIIANAGKAGTVTIATNMAGRGTDIKLEQRVREMGDDGSGVPGGLQIVGTERHEARRIDRQLRGRSGRQGDPGSSVFFLSLEDDLMRLFGSDRVSGIMERLGVEDGEVITHKMVTKTIDRAQKRVEAQNFAIRKHLLEYDDVMNTQREVVYDLRNAALKSTSVRERLFEMVEAVVEELLLKYTDTAGTPADWDMEGLAAESATIFFSSFHLTEEQEQTMPLEGLRNFLVKHIRNHYIQKANLIEPDILAWNERVILLSTLDSLWKEHLYEMDQLKEGIGLRGYGQRDPLVEYKREGYLLFEQTLKQINETTLKTIFRGITQVHVEKAEGPRRAPLIVSTSHEELESFEVAPTEQPRQPSPGRPAAKQQTVKREGRKIGRNDPCPCGSGKKYKHCCGR
ncbi:MAG: preprotein translocase subunit SecA [Candidatus Latescibacteria bacterium]|nr:preprotein translocase subunit SecA [Candidatus Latescibacterota bacterium]